MYKYILFDLDGTLSDPKVGICTSVQKALEKQGIFVKDINELTPFIGPPLRDSFKEFYGLSPENIEIAIKDYRARYSTVGMFENDLYDGMTECLKSLKAAGKKIALASSKPRVFDEEILKHFGISEYFDVIMGSELNGTRETKVEVMDEALNRLFGGAERDIENCVMVGDRKFDIEAAASFGMKSIGVSYGYGSYEEFVHAGATRICNSVAELKKELLKDE